MIVAASPVVHEPGLLPHRIVIRDLGDEHVVHTQVLEPEKEPWHPKAITSPSRAVRNARTRFEERVRRSLRVRSPATHRREFQASSGISAQSRHRFRYELHQRSSLPSVR